MSDSRSDEPGAATSDRTVSVVLGVGGGIAAYKSCHLARGLREHGHDVTVLPTSSALEFVGEVTWAALSGNPVVTSMWRDAHEVPHVRIGQRADLVVVAPATADLMARAASGAADDVLTATLLTARCPIVLAPAMHTEMWQHPATEANVATLRQRGVIVLDPVAGRLTGSDTGPGRLPEPGALLAICRAALSTERAGDLAGRRVVISAGGTREPIDPVRFLGNSSSGRMGHALAAAAVVRGAEVVLVLANSDLPELPGVETIPVGTAEEMRAAVLGASPDASAVVMAAAVADFRPREPARVKLKKQPGQEDMTLDLVRNPDILADLVRRRSPGQTIVGFAAETGDSDHSVLELGRTKLAAKGCDLLVVNDVAGGRTFGSAENEVTILSTDGASLEVAMSDKETVANRIWDAVLSRSQDSATLPSP